MLHVPVALITEKLRAQSLEDDLKVQREGALQIEGKNVWLSCDGEAGEDQEGNITREKGTVGSVSFLPPLNDNDPVGLGFKRSSPSGIMPIATASHRFLVRPVARMRSNIIEHGPRCMENTMRVFETPPKKKHCRSLSVPADPPPQGLGVNMMSPSPLVEGAKVWRPIPITALTAVGSNSVALQDTRTLINHFALPQQDNRTLSSFTTIGSTPGRFHRNLTLVGVSGGGGCGGISSTRPMPPSPLSIDSGRDTTSDFHTPPHSPIPRPSSASSLRTSHVGAQSWWGNSPGRLRSEVLQSRSLSYDEQISTGLQAMAASGSTPCVVGSSGSVLLSPCRSKIPRCHSQPCVLHDRRCGKKRRRDDRPTLDFHKMTETAYSGKSGPSVTPALDIQKVRWRSDLEQMCIGGLMPIASSPRDTDLPTTSRVSDHAILPAISDLDMAACTDLPSSPPASVISSGIDIREPVKLIGEEEEDEDLEDREESSNCGCHRDSERDESAGMFPLTDLDLEQIENH